MLIAAAPGTRAGAAAAGRAMESGPVRLSLSEGCPILAYATGASAWSGGDEHQEKVLVAADPHDLLYRFSPDEVSVHVGPELAARAPRHVVAGEQWRRRGDVKCSGHGSDGDEGPGARRRMGIPVTTSGSRRRVRRTLWSLAADC
jgi:hypothetical protein